MRKGVAVVGLALLLTMMAACVYAADDFGLDFRFDFSDRHSCPKINRASSRERLVFDTPYNRRQTLSWDVWRESCADGWTRDSEPLRTDQLFGFSLLGQRLLSPGIMQSAGLSCPTLTEESTCSPKAFLVGQPRLNGLDWGGGQGLCNCFGFGPFAVGGFQERWRGTEPTAMGVFISLSF